MMNIVIIIFYVMLGIEALLLIPFTTKFWMLDKPTRLIYYYVISCLVFAGGSVIWCRLFKNNMCFFAFMHYMQFLILSLYYKNIINNKYIKFGIDIIASLLLIFALIDFFIIEGKDFFNSMFVTVRNVFLISYSIVYFIQLIKDEKLIKQSIYINSLSSFWFNVAIFIFLCGFFMFGLCANYLQIIKIDALFMLVFTYTIGIVHCALLYIGLRKFHFSLTNNYYEFKRVY